MAKPLEGIYDDERFRALPRRRQADLLVELSGRERAEVEAELEQRIPSEPEGYQGAGTNLKAGAAGGALGSINRAENIAEEAIPALERWTGRGMHDIVMDPGALGFLLKGAGGSLTTENVQDLEATAAKGGTTLGDRVTQLPTALAASAPEFLLATRTLGLPGAFAAMGGMDEMGTGKTAEDTLMGTAKGAAFGALWKWMERFSRPARAVVVGGADLGFHGDPLSAGVNATFAAIPGARVPRARPARAPVPEPGRPPGRAAPEPIPAEVIPEAPGSRPEPGTAAERMQQRIPRVEREVEPSLRSPERTGLEDPADPAALEQYTRTRGAAAASAERFGRAGEPPPPEAPPILPGRSAPPQDRPEPAAPAAEPLQTVEAAPLEAQPSPQLAERIQQSGARFRPGPNYVGSRTFEGAELTKPVPKKLRGRGDILYNLARTLELPIQQGKLRTRGFRGGKNALGFYQKRTQLLRIKRWGDIETAAHEIVHGLADRHPAFRELYTGKRFKEELRGISYDVKSAEEGLSEFGRLWFSQRAVLDEPVQAMRGLPGYQKPITATRASKQLIEAWDAAIKTLPPKQQKAILAAQKDMHAFFEQGALASLRSKRKPQGRRPAGDVLDGLGDEIREGLTDRTHGLLKLERATTGGEMPDGPWRSAQRLGGLPWIQRGLLERGVPYWGKINGKPAVRLLSNNASDPKSAGNIGLLEALRPVSKTREQLESFLDYATARRARELTTQRRENLFSPEEIEAGMRLETPLRKQVFDTVNDFQNRAVKFAVEGGVLAQSNVNRWLSMNRAFSFRRDLSGGNARSGGKGSDGLQPGSVIKQLRGSSRNLRDPIINMIDGPMKLIQATLENQVRRKVAELAMRPGAGRFLTELGPEMRQVKFHRDTVLAGLRKFARQGKHSRGYERQLEDAIRTDIESVNGMPELMEFWTSGPPKGSNVMTVLEGGQPRYYEVLDDQVRRALESFRPEPPGWFMGMWDKVRRLKQSAITLDPAFIYANGIRDPLMSTIMTRTGNQALTSAARGMKEIWQKSDTFWDFIANGGGGASVRDSASNLHAQIVGHARRIGVPRSRLIATARDVVRVDRLLLEIGQKIEMAPKVGEYARAIAQGKSAGEAGFMGRQVNTDYNMHGNWAPVRFMAQTMTFFNAMVASGDRMYRALVRDPDYKAATWLKMGVVGAASAALYELNRDNPRYHALSDEAKAAYWHFFVPIPPGLDAIIPDDMIENGQLHLLGPKIWEAGMLGTFAEYTMAALHQDERAGPLLAQARDVLLHNFGISLPVGVDMGVEQWAGKNLHSGGPLEPLGTQDMDPADRSRDSGSEMLRQFGRAQRTVGIGSGSQLSPARAEALLRGLVGNWAGYGLAIADRAFFAKSWEEVVKGKVSPHADDIAPLTRLLERPGGRSRWPGDFFDAWDELENMAGSAKEARRRGDREALRHYTPALVALKQDFDRVRRQITGLRYQARSVRESGVLTPTERKRRLDQIERREHTLEQQALERKKRIERRERGQ